MFNINKRLFVVAIPVSISASSNYIKIDTKTIPNNDHDDLVHVHVFHRHGDRTPWYAIKEPDDLRHIWVPRLSKQYTSFHEHNNQLKVNKEHVYSWHNISTKLRGISLAYKYDNWNIKSPLIYHSLKDDHFNQLIEHKTTDNPTRTFMGQLTEKGTKQLENVGIYLRKRYIEQLNYLPNIYDINNTNLHYHSTNVARTIQSADCVLHTLYPMEKRCRDSSLIPLYVDYDLTYLNPGRMQRNFCEKLNQKAQNNAQYILKSIDNRFNELTNMITEHYSIPLTVPFGAHAVAFDEIVCGLAHQDTLKYIHSSPNNFSNDDLIEYGKYMAKIEAAIQGLDRETLRLSWGNVLYKMISIMKESNSCIGKMIISSCHDNSIMCVLSSLYGNDIHNSNIEWPKYGSYIVFEVWKQNNSKKYVKVLYNGNVLNVFNGNDYIYLDDLEDKWKDIMIDEETYFNDACLC